MNERSSASLFTFECENNLFPGDSGIIFIFQQIAAHCSCSTIL